MELTEESLPWLMFQTGLRAVRAVRKSTLDRVGPGSCYAWGLIPPCSAIEAVCRASHADDDRPQRR